VVNNFDSAGVIEQQIHSNRHFIESSTREEKTYYSISKLSLLFSQWGQIIFGVEFQFAKYFETYKSSE
jgi:hypothetical protein